MKISGQPVISRETRRLLITVVVALAALWVLARIRFQQRPATSTPMPNVLAQLRPVSSYADLARVIADIRPGIIAAVSASEGGRPALRIRDDAAVTLMPGPADTPLAFDRATNLAIVRHPIGEMPGVMPWAPRLLDYPRYLVAVDVTGGHVALRPVFVGGLFPVSSPFWPGELWTFPAATAIAPGTFVFTTEGALVGLSVDHNGQTALIPVAVLFRAVEQMQRQRGTPGDLGIAIQPLSSEIASATGGATGVVITAVNPSGAAAGKLLATEVIEAINGAEIHTPDDWRAGAARVSTGDTLTLRVRGAEGLREVQVTAAASTASTEPTRELSLGLRLRTIPKVGAEVLSVQPNSSAERAGIQEGDIITVARGRSLPASADVLRAFSSLPKHGSLVVAIARGVEHRVIVLKK